MPRKVHDGIRKRCRCPRRQWSKCLHPWHFGFHHDAREWRYSLDKIARARAEQPPTTKSDAVWWRERLPAEIRAGRFVDPDAAPPAPAAPDVRLTFGDVCAEYLKRHVQIPTRRPGGRSMMELLVAMLRRAEIPAANSTTIRLEAKPIDMITRADVEAVRLWRRQELTEGKSRPGVKGGEAGINRLLSRLRHLFSWAIAEGYLTETPFKRGPVNVVKLEMSVEGSRTRRLVPSITRPDGSVQDGEETRLLAHAGPQLRPLIVAALSTGCRLGELLSLQWSQIRRDEQGQARWIVLPAAKTKTGEARVIPVGPRLRAELDMRMTALRLAFELRDTEELPNMAHAFGNEICEQRKRSTIRDAWIRACQAANITDLHFHDLRREFASRLLESHADLHDVQMFLGHAAITTTSRYLQSTPVRLERALARLEAASARDGDKPAEEPPAEASVARPEVTPNLLN